MIRHLLVGFIMVILYIVTTIFFSRMTSSYMINPIQAVIVGLIAAVFVYVFLKIELKKF